MDGVRTAEGGEGVTGAMIRARIWVDGEKAQEIPLNGSVVSTVDVSPPKCTVDSTGLRRATSSEFFPGAKVGRFASRETRSRMEVCESPLRVSNSSITMCLKAGLIISICLLGVFLAACGNTGRTEKPGPTVSGLAVTSAPTGTPVPSSGGDSTSDSSMRSKPTPATEDPGKAAADTPTPASPNPAPTTTLAPQPTPTPSRKVGPEVGQAAPDFTVTTVDGEVLALSNFLGNRPFILYFFATW